MVDSLTIVAIRDGDFNNPLTWLGGVVPFAGCSIVISTGIRVTLSRPALTFPLKKIDIFGRFGCGEGADSFQFNFPTVIAVHSGGEIEDRTVNKQFRFPGGSLLTIFPGGSFAAAGTVIQIFTSTGLGQSIKVTSPSGPFTCGILPDGSVLSYKRITLFVIQSGGFTSGETYLGGEAPTGEGCTSGCAVYVLKGLTLSTADLDGVLKINIAQLDVASGAFLELGTRGSNKGFRFSSAVQLNVFGALSFVCSGGGIFIPSGDGILSAINFFGGGSFISTITTFIQTFSILTGVNVGSSMTVTSGISGPYYVVTSATGEISISVTSMKDLLNVLIEFNSI